MSTAPKIKLTLKIPTTQTNTVNNNNNNNNSTNSINDIAVNSSSVKPTSKKRGSNVSTPSKQPNIGDSTVISSVSSFIKQMKSFKCRHWQLQDQKFITIPNNKDFTFIGWRTMEGSSRYNVPVSPKKKSKSSSSQGKKDKMIVKDSDFISTFVCIFEGCHKIFDSKDKWRRHQVSHKKKHTKEQMNNINIAQQEILNTSLPTSEINMEE